MGSEGNGIGDRRKDRGEGNEQQCRNGERLECSVEDLLSSSLHICLLRAC